MPISNKQTEAIILSKTECWHDLVLLCRDFGEWNRQERALFGEGVKNWIAEKRTAMRVLKKLLAHKHAYAETPAGRESNAQFAVKIIEKHLTEIKVEIEDACEKCLNILDQSVRQQAPECQCWCNKLKGDIYRYKAEVDPVARSEALSYYQRAQDIMVELPSDCAGLKSSVLCNLACLYAEIDHDHARARSILEDAVRQYPTEGLREFELPVAVSVMNHNKEVWA